MEPTWKKFQWGQCAIKQLFVDLHVIKWTTSLWLAAVLGLTVACCQGYRITGSLSSAVDMFAGMPFGMLLANRPAKEKKDPVAWIMNGAISR